MLSSGPVLVVSFSHSVSARGAVDHPPQDLAGGGHQHTSHLVSQGGLVLFRGFVVDQSIHQCRDLAPVSCHGLDIIQHAVLPQVTGNIVQDQPVDLAFFVQGIVSDIQSVQVYPR